MAAFKKVYQLAVAVVLVNVLMLALGTGFLVAGGKLTVDRLRQIVEIVRDGETVTEEPDAPGKQQLEQTPAVAKGPVPGSVEDEIAQRNAERVILEADQRLILANRQLVEVRRRREDLESQEAEHVRIRAQQAEERKTEGFQKDLEILSMLKPKVAVDSLLARPVDAAARMLMAMDGRKSKKIFEAASKDPRKWARMLEIQKRFHDLSGEQSVGAGAPGEEAQ